MPWFKVDDNLGFHHKVIAAGNPAMGLWVRAGSICAQQLTDGFVPDHMVASLGTVAQARKLVQVGLWDRVKGGYTFHEWEERQPRRAEVEAEREAAKERMRARRAARKTGTTHGTNASERFTSGTRPADSDQVSAADDSDGSASPEASSQVSAVCSGEHPAKFGRSSGEVRDVFGNPDPTRPDPTNKEERPRKRASALPDDFRPSDKHVALARELGVDLRREWAKFTDYARANGKTYKDWSAALNNWIRKAAEYGGRPAPLTVVTDDALLPPVEDSWMRRRKP